MNQSIQIRQVRAVLSIGSTGLYFLLQCLLSRGPIQSKNENSRLFFKIRKPTFDLNVNLLNTLPKPYLLFVTYLPTQKKKTLLSMYPILIKILILFSLKFRTLMGPTFQLLQRAGVFWPCQGLQHPGKVDRLMIEVILSLKL